MWTPPWATFAWYVETCLRVNCEEWTWQEDVSC
jgi:hypothetical protein